MRGMPTKLKLLAAAVAAAPAAAAALWLAWNMFLTVFAAGLFDWY